MPANDISFNQVATFLNTIQAQVTGRAGISVVDSSSFATAADITLKAGHEKLYNAISTVLGPTIFSIRPYNRKFRGLELTERAYKLHTRKLQIVDGEFQDNATMKWPILYDAEMNPPSGNGESVDQQTIRKPEIVQTNYYGANTYADDYTIYDEQLEVAFTSVDEMARFISMITMNVSNMMEQARENFARYTLLNYAGALYDLGSTRAINLLAEYNAITGGTYTVDDIYNPENFPGFMKWAFARVKQICSEMSERSTKYQSAINGKWITRHTPYEDQRLYMFAPNQYQMEASVLSGAFNDEYLKRAYTEEVSFWQNINNPAAIHVKPVYTGPQGTPISGGSHTLNHVFGVICDREAVGYSVIKSTMKAAPYNAKADYQTFYLKDYHKNFNDVSEKGVLLYLANS